MSANREHPLTHSFQAEVARLLDLMVHAVYTDKEIFLRELISNASDACDKLRYEAIARPELMGEGVSLSICIKPDKAAGRLVISDNGIGMDQAELVDNLGTIARSGTRAFLDKLKSAPEGASLIGQFGVGFYSAFMVADEIEVLSRKAGTDEVSIWYSDGINGFTVTAAAPERVANLAHGTEITLKLKADAQKFLEPVEIERVVRTYSNHILFPVEIADQGGNARQINAASALWQRGRSEVKPEEYTEVYRNVSGYYDEPLLTVHYKAEGRQSYAVLLFVPHNRPFDLFDPERKGRVKLYVRRVYITDDADLLPSYLRFARGVVDSEDVPLNISREMLQSNPLVAQMRKAITTRMLAEIETLAGKDDVGYETMWEAFGPVLKEGLYEDPDRRDQLLKLLRFRSTTGSRWRSFADYIAALRPNQTEIYYLIGDSLERLKASPQLEAARARGVEVLLLTDPIDHFWTTVAQGFEGKPLKSLTRGEVDLSLMPRAEDAAKDAGPSGCEPGPLLERLKTALGDAVSDVRASKRLVASPVCLVAPGQGPDRGLDKLLSRQDRGIGLKPILEVNMDHPLVAAIALRAESAATESMDVADLAGLLLDEAHILEGEVPADPALFAERLNRLAIAALQRK